MVSFKQLENVCVLAAKAGGLKALSFFNKPYKISFKGKTHDYGSIVTEADFAAEKAVREVISRYFPEHAVIGEEQGGKASKGFTWYIDPVDGTGNFSRGLNEWGCIVGVALDGIPVAGAIHFPSLKKLFRASKGNGAFCNGKKLHTSNRELRDSLVLVSAALNSPYRKKGVYASLEAFGNTMASFRVYGCAAHSALMLSEGKADFACKFDLYPWDFCGSCVIIREAGGICTNADGKEWTVNDNSFITAANEKLFKQAFPLLKKRL